MRGRSAALRHRLGTESERAGGKDTHWTAGMSCETGMGWYPALRHAAALRIASMKRTPNGRLSVTWFPMFSTRSNRRFVQLWEGRVSAHARRTQTQDSGGNGPT